MKTCGACNRYIIRAAASCPFCGAASRSGRAPLWSRLTMVSLAFAVPSACVDDGEDDAGVTDGMSGSATLLSDSASSPVTLSAGEGQTTVDDDPDAGEGSTYAGPDEDWDTWGDSSVTDPQPPVDPETTTAASSESTTFAGSSEDSSGSSDTSSESGDASTGEEPS